MNKQFVKDIAKAVKKTPFNQELPAGATDRRWEPEVGVRKHNERIHKESKIADDQKNLPFSFRKPPKAIAKPAAVMCDNCGHVIFATKLTVGVICSGCGEFSTVSEVVYDR